MLEELQRRHYSEATTHYYIRHVERFARHFHCSPDRLGPQHIREYQAHLFTKQKLSPGAVTNHLCALRFFYIQTLKKRWSIADTPNPKKTHRLPTILSQEEVAQLIDAAPTPYYRTILMTLYATGLRNAELTRLKVSDIDSRRMVIHVQGGKGRQDRDVMLSPVLLEKLQRLAVPRQSLAHRRSADGHQNAASRVPVRCSPRRDSEEGLSSRPPPLLCHTLARSRRRPAHHSDPVGSSRPERDCSLSPSFAASPARDGQSSGFVGTERQITTGEIDESAASGGGRPGPHRRHCFHRAQPSVAPLDAHQSPACHCTLSHRRTRRSHR